MIRRAFILSMAALLVSPVSGSIAAPAADAQAFPQSSWAPSGRSGSRGDEVPLSQVIRDLKSEHGGQHLDARRKGDRYEIVWIDGEGRRLTITVDVKTGRTLSVRG